MKSEKISKMGVDRFRILGISQDIWAIAAALSISLSVEGARFETHPEQVMGTSLELQVEGPNLLGIEQAEKICLEAIDSWSDRLSTYQSNSEISQWMRLPNQAIELSPECMAFLVNIGGDMVALGSMQARVDIANPRSASDNDLIETITLQGGAKPPNPS